MDLEAAAMTCGPAAASRFLFFVCFCFFVLFCLFFWCRFFCFFLFFVVVVVFCCFVFCCCVVCCIFALCCFCFFLFLFCVLCFFVFFECWKTAIFGGVQPPTTPIFGPKAPIAQRNNHAILASLYSTCKPLFNNTNQYWPPPPGFEKELGPKAPLPVLLRTRHTYKPLFDLQAFIQQYK